MTLPPLLDWALYWARRGFRVFPCDRVTKAPLIKSPVKGQGGYKFATTDEDVIRQWWTSHPDAMIGAAPGAGVLVLDVEAPGAHKSVPEGGFIALEALIAAHPEAPIPQTFTVRTGTGGGHFWLIYDPARYLITQGAGKADRGMRGIDFRAQDGYVILPPSTRSDGLAYTLANDVPIGLAPDWLCALIASSPLSAQVAPGQCDPAEATPEQIAHAESIMRNALDRLRKAKEGDGFDTLKSVAVTLGGLWALSLERRRTALLGVVLGEWESPFHADRPGEAERVIDGCLGFGGDRPLDLAPDEAEDEAELQGWIAAIRHLAGPSIPTASAYAYGPTVPSLTRPTIHISPDIFVNTSEAISALALDSNRPDGDPVRDRMYQRDGGLTRVVYVAAADALAPGALFAAGSPRLAPLKLSTLCEHLTRVAYWTVSKRRKGEDPDSPVVSAVSRTLPPERVVSAVADRREYPGIRPITGIAETPAFLRDGSILETPGYDLASGFVYVPGADFPRVPDAPTQDDARRALAELQEVWCDFPYHTASDRMVPVAALLTLLARPAIGDENCPAFLFDANTRGSGKTRQVDALSCIATGRPFAKTTFPNSEEELEKMLGGFAVSGAAIAAFDNVTGHFGGGPLDKVLTCGGRVQLRILGKTETPIVTWYAIVIGTGNNVVVIGDTARRTLVSRLMSTLERPEDRSDFRHPDLLSWVKSERTRLVVAGLTILRAWHLAGRPDGGIRPWGSFETWSLVPRALAFAGGQNVLDCRAELREGEREDPDTEALRLLLENWHTVAPRGTASIGELMAQLFPALGGFTPPGADSDGIGEVRTAMEIALDTLPGRPPTKGQLGTWLGTRRERNVGGWMLVKKTLDGYNRWTRNPAR